MSEYKFRFRLKSGSHYDGKRNIAIEPGDIYETDDDMIKAHGKIRWELVDEKGQESIEDLKARIKLLEGRVGPQEAPKPELEETDLESKSIKELRTFAAAMDPPVDLKDVTGKAEIINAIRFVMDAA